MRQAQVVWDTIQHVAPERAARTPEAPPSCFVAATTQSSNPAPPQRGGEPDGFTLIELLVVITIIVVLLALLTPALDRAIYQAELAVCAAQQRSVGQAAVQYAMQYQRRYPHRPAVNDPDSNWQAVALHHSEGLTREYDDRPVFGTFLDINGMLNDPLVDAVDLETDDPLTSVFGSVSLWFGFKYVGERGMLRVGDRLGYGGMQFDILTSDRDCVRGPDVQSSHPDKRGILHNLAVADGEHAWLGGNQGIGAVSGNAIKLTLSLWVIFGANQRGDVDTNYTYQDLSVKRFTDVRWNEWADGDRMTRIGSFVNKKDTFQHMPRN